VLSIGKLQRGEKGQQYYEQLYEDDYYNRRGNGEPPGRWEGRLAAAFGLSGFVEKEDFDNVYHGRSPTGEQLREERPNGRPGHDLTYSVPKDVSIIYGFAGRKLRREMDAAMYGSAQASFEYVEKKACMTRLGKNGTEVVEGGGLLAAFYPHDMSRELDPQKHIHVLVFNFTEGPDGKYRALDARELYAHKHAAGALFRTELAARLEKLGFEIERDGFSFSIVGVPPSLRSCEEITWSFRSWRDLIVPITMEVCSRDLNPR
jgi:conjugative relaxase-like TrwC/TraI family protein